MEYRFEVLFVYLRQSAVITQQIGTELFSIDGASTLGDKSVSDLTVPRMVDANGMQRMDVFAFCVPELSEDDFKEGQVVVLKANGPAASRDGEATC